MSGPQWAGVALVAIGAFFTAIAVSSTIDTVKTRREGHHLVGRSRYFVVWIGWAIWGLPELVFGIPLLFPGGGDWLDDLICTLLPNFQAC